MQGYKRISAYPVEPRDVCIRFIVALALFAIGYGLLRMELHLHGVQQNLPAGMATAWVRG